MRNYGNIAKGYGYNVSVIDLRNPTRSNGNNLLHLVNKYMDLYQQENKLIYKVKAEKYAKIISKTIILSGMDAAGFGQNAYFYDAAEGLLTATILLWQSSVSRRNGTSCRCSKSYKSYSPLQAEKERISFNSLWSFYRTTIKPSGLREPR